MSFTRMCKICFKSDGMRFNFGDNTEAEAAHHNTKWCSCPYETSEEMMLDQDMGFTDPNWIPIAKSFLSNYRRMREEVTTNEQSVRLFLKLLNYHSKDYSMSIELKDIKTSSDNKNEYVIDGNPKKPTKFDIF